MQNINLDDLIRKLIALPGNLYPHGTLSAEVLKGMLRHCSKFDILHSLETGCGKSTLLFSHLSRDHKVFVLPDGALGDGTGHFMTTQTSPLLNRSSVEFIEGPTQRTLPEYCFEHPLDAAFIDGPHGYPFPELEYYTIYPLLNPGAILIVDDIHIPTIRNMFDFLKTDEMFCLIEVVHNTAFFRRTAKPTFDPYGDGWWLQNYNKERDRLKELIPDFLKAWVPKPIKRSIKDALNSVIKRFS